MTTESRRAAFDNWYSKEFSHVWHSQIGAEDTNHYESIYYCWNAALDSQETKQYVQCSNCNNAVPVPQQEVVERVADSIKAWDTRTLDTSALKLVTELREALKDIAREAYDDQHGMCYMDISREALTKADSFLASATTNERAMNIDMAKAALSALPQQRVWKGRK